MRSLPRLLRIVMFSVAITIFALSIFGAIHLTAIEEDIGLIVVLGGLAWTLSDLYLQRRSA